MMEIRAHNEDNEVSDLLSKSVFNTRVFRNEKMYRVQDVRSI